MPSFLASRGLARWLGSLALAASCACTGCGGGKVAVKGAVTYDGRPVEIGRISFEPTGGAGGPSSSAPIANGRYDLSGELAVPPGKKLVRIWGDRKTGKKITVAAAGAPRETDEVEPLIPAKYNDQSTLTVEVVAGQTNDLPFDLKP